MANNINLKNTVIGLLVAVFATTLFAQKPRDVSGTVVGSDGKKVAKTTVILMAEDGTEVKRVETSRRGKFSFKKVSPGNYTVEIDAGEQGRLSSPAEVSEENVKLGDLQLTASNEVSDNGNASTQDEGAYDPTLSETSTEETNQASMENLAQSDSSDVSVNGQEFIPDPGKDYILNELSFEIKKMTAG